MVDSGVGFYDMCLLIEAALLVGVVLVHTHHGFAAYLAAAACGLQNGMATQWGGAVLRTTHVSGLFTDVGLLSGSLLSLLCRKRCGTMFNDFDKASVADDLSKLSLLLGLAFCFTVGLFSGAKLVSVMDYRAFLVPAGITGSIGFICLIYRVFVFWDCCSGPWTAWELFSESESTDGDAEVEVEP